MLGEMGRGLTVAEEEGEDEEFLNVFGHFL